MSNTYPEKQVDKQDAAEVKNYTRTPNMLIFGYSDISPQEKWLYVCLKHLCGKQGTRYLSLRYISDQTGISVGALSSSKDKAGKVNEGMIRHLHDAGLIHSEIKKPGGKGNPQYHITITDVWGLNQDFFAARPKFGQEEKEESSPSEIRTDSNATCPNSEQPRPNFGQTCPKSITIPILSNILQDSSSSSSENQPQKEEEEEEVFSPPDSPGREPPPMQKAPKQEPWGPKALIELVYSFQGMTPTPEQIQQDLPRAQNILRQTRKDEQEQTGPFTRQDILLVLEDCLGKECRGGWYEQGFLGVDGLAKGIAIRTYTKLKNRKQHAENGKSPAPPPKPATRQSRENSSELTTRYPGAASLMTKGYGHG